MIKSGTVIYINTVPEKEEEMVKNRKFIKSFSVLLMLCVACMAAGCSVDDGKNIGGTDILKDGDEEEDADDSEKDDSLDKILDDHQLILGLDAAFKPMGY